jgi:hypothetical protein
MTPSSVSVWVFIFNGERYAKDWIRGVVEEDIHGSRSL